MNHSLLHHIRYVIAHVELVLDEQMDGLWQHALSVFLGFFAIMNPLPNTVAFVGLTAHEDKHQQIKTASKALMISFFIVCAFAVLGKSIFHLFGITLAALRITGGIIVFIIGYQMLKGAGNTLHKGADLQAEDVSVSPLAVPLLAGPGTIATAMNFSAAAGWEEIILTISMFGILCLLTFFSFIYGRKIIQLVGDNGLNIITRLMGLILAVIGCQMLILGIIDVIQHPLS